ncbi:MAG TPA: hypothetical protein VGF13_19105 [Verrucomicrobiae bacterium]|jgi:hypothetical protein
MKSKLKLKQLLVAMACGALMAGAVVYACDNETPKSATNPCHTNPVCAGNAAMYDEFEDLWYCNDAATFPIDYHTECKPNGEEKTNCKGELAQCWKMTTCEPIWFFVWFCVEDTAYGDWRNSARKVEEACP